MTVGSLLLTISVVIAGQATQPATREWKPIGRFDREVIRESSGVVRSRQHDGIFWTHSDSGNAAEIFAIRATGELVARVRIDGAVNSDWEDLAADKAGFLYVADIGNNSRLRVQRQVYKFREPHPFAESPRAQVETTFTVSYADEPFDAEGLVVYREGLYVVSKSRDKPTQLYRLVPPDPDHPTRLQPEPLGTVPVSFATGADVSASEDKLAVCNGHTLAVFRTEGESPLPGPDAVLGQVWFPHGSIEACGFDGGDVVLTAESGQVYRVTTHDLEQRTRFR